MKRIFFLYTFTLLAACQSYPPAVDVRYLNDANLEGTVSVINNFPKENSIDVPVDTEIWIEFSDKIRTSSVDSFRFQVLDEFGIPVKGKIQYEKEDRVLKFTPRYRNTRANLSRATTYTVHARYLEDQSGYLIGSFSFKFRTVHKAAKSGSFYIKKVFPDSSLIFPGDQIAVQFSEEVEADPNSNDNCSASLWNDAFQVLKVQIFGEELSFTGISGKVCRIYNETSNKWDTLQFVPDDDESILWGGEYVDIVIRPTPGLRSAVTGEELMPGSGEQVRAWVIPIDQLLRFLF